jgi:hypothetical protein
MFKLDSEEDLLATFRPKDRAQVELASGMTFPLIVRGYTAWVHPSGGKVFLVFAAAGDAPTGIVFATNGAGPQVPNMCDWCHSAGPSVRAGMLTAKVNAKKLAGVHVCYDLSCRAKLEEEANRLGKSAKPAMDRVVARMGKFASDVLKIDLSGAGR